jgi:protein-L-isoaspartate O-methyltransferase
VKRVVALDFDRIYDEDPDPWKLESSPYERHKHAATLAALRGGPYHRALEIGCASGVFTARLATRCTNVVAIDFSRRALAMAKRRLASVDNVEVRLGSFPEDAPAGPWSIVVCSEVLYYLDAPALEAAIAWLAEQLTGGASVVAVHWRGSAVTEPLRGDDVHDRMRLDLARWHTHDARRARYRLDVFEATGTPRRSAR